MELHIKIHRLLPANRNAQSAQIAFLQMQLELSLVSDRQWETSKKKQPPVRHQDKWAVFTLSGKRQLNNIKCKAETCRVQGNQSIFFKSPVDFFLHFVYNICHVNGRLCCNILKSVLTVPTGGEKELCEQQRQI